ncbi:MAG TPA: response regulator [Terriglobales bacterium]|nr:response regulator [Terriglobales bacterium]
MATTDTPVVTATANGNDSQPRIIVAVDDMFFLAKIRETARQLKVPIELAKTDRELMEKMEPPPSLIILDLNSVGLKPLPTIGKLRHKQELKKTPIIGFLSHLQADLKIKAQEAGCNLVMPRSAFSQNLPGLLRRHGLPETV